LCVSIVLSVRFYNKYITPVLGSQPAGDWSHKPGGRLPLLSARPAVTSPVAEHHRQLTGTSATKAHMCKLQDLTKKSQTSFTCRNMPVLDLLREIGRPGSSDVVNSFKSKINSLHFCDFCADCAV